MPRLFKDKLFPEILSYYNKKILFFTFPIIFIALYFRATIIHYSVTPYILTVQLEQQLPQEIADRLQIFGSFIILLLFSPIISAAIILPFAQKELSLAKLYLNSFSAFKSGFNGFFLSIKKIRFNFFGFILLVCLSAVIEDKISNLWQWYSLVLIFFIISFWLFGKILIKSTEWISCHYNYKFNLANATLYSKLQLTIYLLITLLIHLGVKEIFFNNLSWGSFKQFCYILWQTIYLIPVIVGYVSLIKKLEYKTTPSNN
jgi:hypothetical protein